MSQLSVAKLEKRYKARTVVHDVSLGVASGFTEDEIPQALHGLAIATDVVERCLRSGLDVRGYYCWTLIDNYEWLQGLDARFGLYRVDFSTLKRIPTPAATYYAYLISSRSQL